MSLAAKFTNGLVIFHSLGIADGKSVQRPDANKIRLLLNNLTPRRVAACTGRLQKRWTSYREKYLESLEIKEGACTFAPQALNSVERPSAVPVR